MTDAGPSGGSARMRHRRVQHRARPQPVARPASPVAGRGKLPASIRAITQPTGATSRSTCPDVGAQNVYSVPLQLNYDPAKLQSLNVSNGGSFRRTGRPWPWCIARMSTTGTLQITATRPPVRAGSLAKGRGDADLHGEGQRAVAADHSRGGARDPAMQAITGKRRTTSR